MAFPLKTFQPAPVSANVLPSAFCLLPSAFCLLLSPPAIRPAFRLLTTGH